MKQIFAASFLNIFAGILFIGFFSGCSVLDPAEEIPSYLHIDSMSLSVTSAQFQGTSRATITDAWVFMDGQLLGGFELPCNIPILAEGTHHFIINGGVKENGLTSLRAIYPSWKGWEGNLDLVRGQKTIISPGLTYYPGITYAWLEDFDQSGTSLVPESSSSATIHLDSLSYAYEGAHSGYIHLNTSDSINFVAANSAALIMSPTQEVWLEFDYMSDCNFTIGVEDGSYHLGYLLVNPNAKWTKVYVRMTDALAQAAQEHGDPSTIPYKVYFAALNQTSSEQHIYLDNIKLLK